MADEWFKVFQLHTVHYKINLITFPSNSRINASVEWGLMRLPASASFRGCGSSDLRACYQMFCVEMIFKGWWTPVIGKFLATKIADNGVPINSSVRELFKLEFSVHGAEQHLLVCLHCVSTQMTPWVKGHYRSAINLR